MHGMFIPFESGLWWLGLALLGIVVGFVAGMFGLGGGFLLIPLLHIAFGIPVEVAVGTGLCMTIGTGIAAFRRHRRLKHGEEKLSWIMLGGALIGVRAGADLVNYLGQYGQVDILGHTAPAVKLWVSAFYIILLGSVSVFMLVDSRRSLFVGPGRIGPLARIAIPPLVDLPVSGLRMSLAVLAYLGLLLGFLSGVMGLGGGVIFMPLLVYGLGMRMKMAAGTGVLVLVATSIAGTAAHAALHHVHLGIAMTLLAGSTIAAPLGASVTGNTPGPRLRCIFGTLVLITAGAVLWDLLRELSVI
jgi:uncharacterized protein